MQHPNLPLSRNQKAIWLESLLYPNQPIFNIGTYILLNGIPDEKILERAINEVIAKNDALRMKIEQDRNEPFAVFKHKLDFKLNVQKFDTIIGAKLWMESTFTEAITLDDDALFDIQLVIAGDKSFLYLKYHHICIDGWGRALMVQSIADTYNQLIAGEKPDTSNGSFQDFLQQRVANPTKATINFWQSSFDDSFQRMALFDPLFPNKKMPSERYVQPWKSPEFYGKYDLKEQFYAQLAALAATLAVSLGRTEITFGIPLLNRHDDVARSTIGYFVGLIPLRIRITSDIQFSELVEVIKSQLRATQKHRNASIQEINKYIEINKSEFHQAYDVVFSFEPHNHRCKFADIEVIEAGTFSSSFEQNPIVIHAQQFIEDDAVEFVWDYNTRFLNNEMVNDLSSRFQRVLNAITIDSSQYLSELPVLTDEDREILEKFTSGGTQKLPHESIIDWVEHTAKRYPDRIILRNEKEEFSYEKLIQRAKQTAALIQNENPEKGHQIGIMLTRSADVIVAIASCIFAGYPHVYIDPELGKERQDHMLNSAQINIVIAEKRDRVKGKTIISLSEEKTDLKWKRPKTKATDPVYSIFTSGTTGTPKGVSISNQSLINLVTTLNDQFFRQSEKSERLALVSSFGFDASIQFVFCSLCLGHSLCIAPKSAQKDGRELANYLAKGNITHVDGIPAQLTSMYLRNTRPPDGFVTKHYLIGGEVMQIEQIRLFLDWLNAPAVITNAYGPTECTVDATLFTFSETEIESLEEIPIGRPLPNTTIHVLDSRGIAVPIGAKGNIYIGGIGLAQGYLNEPELTEKAFIQHPVYGRLYHTGDIGSWQENGNLKCHGRKDDQVKIRGFRIELSEIEENLTKIPQIEEAYVVVQEKEKTSQLVACIRLNGRISDAEIKVELLKWLPEYMVPHALMRMDSFPRTKSGKIDRAHLKLMDFSEGLTISTDQPQTRTEKKVAVIVSGLLEIELPDVNQSFFSLGGDSLSLIYLITELENVFRLKIPVYTIADKNSIREIAAFLDNRVQKKAPQILLTDGMSAAKSWAFPQKLPPKAKGNSALLTGATGFVGAFLLQELIEEHNTVYCFVRASSELHAHIRLRATLEQYNINLNPADDRIRYITGDLNLPELGIGKEKWSQLTKEVTKVYHCGAEVHFLKNLDTVHQTNVQSTSELLKLCCDTSLKEFHLISTVGVFTEKGTMISESHPLDKQVHTKNNGYEATKWIAEGVTMNAMEHGIPCSIYRLARVTGHSESGIARFDDFFHRFLLGCIDLGVYPQNLIDQDTDLTPVDLASKSIVHLAKNNQGIYHIINPNRVLFKDLFNGLKSRRTPMKAVSLSEFLKLATEKSKYTTHPLYTILPILKQKSWFSVNSKQFETADTIQALSSSEIQWPDAKKLIQTYATKLRKERNRKSKMN